MKRILTYLALALLLASCVKETDWNLDPAASRLIAVEGIITDAADTQQVRLNWTVAELNAVPEPVTGASVLISNEDSTWQLTETSPGSGIYAAQAKLVAVPGKNYTLLISYDGKIFSGKTSMETGRVFEPLQYKPDDDGTLYHIDWVASAFSTEFPAMWEVVLDWSQVPGYQGRDPQETSARILFYTLPTLDVSQIFAPVVEEISFPAGTLITENRYSLTAAHAGFIREMLMETSWQGGLFSSVPANVATNMSAGATGWFGACGKTSLSLTVTP